MRRCRVCLQDIQDTSRVCEHCGEDLVGGRRPIARPPAIAPALLAPTAATSTTKRCPFCAEEIQGAAIVCKHCGRDLATSTAARSVVSHPSTRPRTRAAGTVAAIVLGLLGLLVIVNLSSGPSTPPHDTYTAAAMCEQFVTKRLRAPASAKFAPFAEQTVAHKGGGEYRVTAYVDSQNGFGALLRLPYTCDVSWQSGVSWKLDDLKLSE